MYNWREMSWDALINFVTDFPLSSIDEQKRLDEIAYREACDEFGELWKAHARNGGDRPTTTPPNP